MRQIALVLITTFIFCLLPSGRSEAYEPPIGIPAPPFGIDEQRPPHPANWPSTENPGSYFVDNTHPDATDEGNEYGYPNKPRYSLPVGIGTWPAGTYVEVHGGPYTVSRGQWRINTAGNVDAPTWLVGDNINKALFRFELILEDTSYLVVQNLRFDTHRQWIRTSGQSHHLVIRFNELTGNPNVVDRTSIIGVSGQAGRRSSDVVIYANEVHDAGDRSGQNEVDINGITNGAYIDRLWVLENHIYNLGGDSIRVGQNEARMPATDALPNFTYIGRNQFHDNGENAIDVKHSNDVIISENELYGFRSTSSSSGEAVVIHENATNVWVVGNAIHDTRIGIINTGATNVWFVSNTLYNIDTTGNFDPSSHFGGGVAMHFRGSSNGGIVANTIHNFDKGIQISGGNNYEITNNIFSSRNRANSFDVMFSNSQLARDSVQDHNLYESFRARVGGSDHTSISSFRASTGLENQGLVGEARFMNAAAANFAIAENSDAIDTGMESSAFIGFQSRYGLLITKDRAGVSRPQGAGWDIGSHEHVAAGPRPMSPTDLTATD